MLPVGLFVTAITDVKIEVAYKLVGAVDLPDFDEIDGKMLEEPF